MSRIVEIVVFAALVATVVFLVVVVWDMKSQIGELSQQRNNQIVQVAQSGTTPVPIGTPASSTGASKEEVEQLKQYFDTALSTISGTTQTVIKETKETVTAVTQTTYIPMGSAASTTNTDWVDVADSNVYIDLVNDYSEDAYVTWEASLKVAHANGIAFARLFDETHGIAVSGSEIKVENSDTYVQTSSGYLPLWRGNNLYKVQIKSLNSFEVTYSSGKVKIRH
jgi:hypothetical protein